MGDGEATLHPPIAPAPPDMSASHAPWRSLLKESLRRNDKLRHSKYLQLATVRPDGRPANRTVVFRGFLWDTDRLTFVTDARSQKTSELAANPWGEIAWYFPDSREQYRLLGRVSVVSKDSPADEKLQRARAAAWNNMSVPGRQQFLWPHPGQPRAGPVDSAEDQALFKPAVPSQDGAVADSFCLCIMDVEEADWLSLKANARKTFGRQAQGWEEAEVNP